MINLAKRFIIIEADPIVSPETHEICQRSNKKMDITAKYVVFVDGHAEALGSEKWVVSGCQQ
ncbi:MAG TPA: hypothetical protein PK303_02465 [bacterium]|nr:hypothetical protein [bacterium]